MEDRIRCGADDIRGADDLASRDEEPGNARLDALALCQRRDRCVRGRQRLASMGRRLLAMHGIPAAGRWWKGKARMRIKAQAPGWVVERLQVNATVIVSEEAHERRLTGALQKAGGKKKIPRGVNLLTFEVLPREAGDWSRFSNRRQVSSYAGLCPHEHGTVSERGDPRVRAILVEMVWRMIRWQPDYRLLKIWGTVFKSPTADAGAKKKAVAAIARQFAVLTRGDRAGRDAGEATLTAAPRACR
jgi:transposase